MGQIWDIKFQQILKVEEIFSLPVFLLLVTTCRPWNGSWALCRFQSDGILSGFVLLTTWTPWFIVVGVAITFSPFPFRLSKSVRNIA